MAIVTRRYQFVGPSVADLTTFVSPTAFVAATFQGPIIDISVDDAMPGVLDALDEYMATLDYEFSPVALKPTTTIIPYAPLAPIGGGTTAFATFSGLALDEEIANWATPRPAFLQSLQINVTANTLGANAEFMVRTATGIGPFGSTAILINVPAGATGTFNQPGPIPINVGDRVALRIAAGGLVGAITFTGGIDAS